MPNESMIIATAADSNTSAVSTNGTFFGHQFLPTGSWSSITSGEVDGQRTFVAISGITTTARSSDGITWEPGNLPKLTHLDFDDGTPDIDLTSSPHHPSLEWEHVSFGNGVFIAIAPNTKRYATSIDGLSWAERLLSTGGRWSSLEWNKDRFIITERGSGRILKSTDGINWTMQVVTIVYEDKSQQVDLSSSTYGKGKYFLTCNGDNSFVLSSSDALTWSPIFIQKKATSSTVKYGNDEFVLVINGYQEIYDELIGETRKDYKNTYSSKDGIRWDAAQVGLEAIQLDLAYSLDFKTMVGVLPGDSNAYVTTDTKVTPKKTFSWLDTTTEMIGQSRHYTAGLTMQSLPFKNRSDIYHTPSDAKNWDVSTTILSRNKVSDHDQSDDPFEVSDLVANLSARRSLYTDYKIRYLGRMIISMFGGQSTIPPRRSKNDAVVINDDSTSKENVIKFTDNPQNAGQPVPKAIRFIDAEATIYRYDREIRTGSDTRIMVTQKAFVGHTTIQSNRSASGETRLGFNWKKCPLPALSQWASIAFDYDSMGIPKFITVSRDSIAALSTNGGYNWLTTLMPTETKWIVSAGSNGKYLYSYSNPEKPASTIAYSTDNTNVWRGGVLPVEQVPCILAIAYGQNYLYESFDGATFKSMELN